jgi:hypothetical protein
VNAVPVEPPPPPCTITTELVGDGNPHQNGLHKQVSEPILCSAVAGCSVSELTSYTIGYTVSGGIAQWISAGFSVEESFTTGNSYTCPGAAGDTVCVWVNLAHTAYTVQDFRAGQCPNPGPQPPVVIKSPNANNAGGEYYCVNGAQYCRNNGDEYWDDSSA